MFHIAKIIRNNEHLIHSRLFLDLNYDTTVTTEFPGFIMLSITNLVFALKIQKLKQSR